MSLGPSAEKFVTVPQYTPPRETKVIDEDLQKTKSDVEELRKELAAVVARLDKIDPKEK
jgi:hypothetical protein